jgi:hypothetical protein
MDLRKGDRVRAVHFPLDTGLRIWPNQGDDSGRVRVVQVTGPDEFAVRFEGSQQDAAAQFPHATWSINDNESVPPGTLGTVDHVDSSNVFIAWDNGRRLGLAPHDIVERVTDRTRIMRRETSGTGRGTSPRLSTGAGPGAKARPDSDAARTPRAQPRIGHGRHDRED